MHSEENQLKHGRAFVLAAAALRRELLSEARVQRLYGHRGALYLLMESEWASEWKKNKNEEENEMVCLDHLERTIVHEERLAGYKNCIRKHLLKMYKNGEKSGIKLSETMVNFSSNLHIIKPRKLIFDV